MKAIQLVETKRGRAIMETTPRYDVILHGKLFGQITFNTRGFIGYLPCPNGSRLDIGERPISAFRREVVLLNRQFARKAVAA